MPMHNWSRSHRSLYHSFYLDWVTQISSRLNAGLLPSAYYALTETVRDGYSPSFVDLSERAGDYNDPGKTGDRRNRSECPPRTWLQAACISPEYAEKVISIRRCSYNSVVAAIRIVTPDTKCRDQRFAAFITWAVEVIRDGIALLIVDPFPSQPGGRRDIAKALWNEFVEEEFVLPTNKPLTLTAFSAGRENMAYVEPFAVGEPLPEMPLFLGGESYVPVPLEESYQTAWVACPEVLREAVERGLK